MICDFSIEKILTYFIELQSTFILPFHSVIQKLVGKSFHKNILTNKWHKGEITCRKISFGAFGGVPLMIFCFLSIDIPSRFSLKCIGSNALKK